MASVHWLGVLYESKGDYGAAKTCFERALEARERTLSSDHPAVLTSVSKLGNLYKDMGEADRAEPLLTRAAEASRAGVGV